MNNIFCGIADDKGIQGKLKILNLDLKKRLLLSYSETVCSHKFLSFINTVLTVVQVLYLSVQGETQEHY